MKNKIQSIPLDKLMPHPDNPNRMSKASFAKLVRNIKRTGKYEPIIVRPSPDLQGARDDRRVGASPSQESPCASVFQIINGYHRWRALSQLGYKTADAIVWDIDDEHTDILLATLNRLGGQDILDKKLALLARLNERMKLADLAKLLPQTKNQLEKLINLNSKRTLLVRCSFSEGGNFANPLVFFVSDKQQEIIENALSLAGQNKNEKTKAARNAAALTYLAQYFLNNPG